VTVSPIPTIASGTLGFESGNDISGVLCVIAAQRLELSLSCCPALTNAVSILSYKRYEHFSAYQSKKEICYEWYSARSDEARYA
jgi:hypothetical protein